LPARADNRATLFAMAHRPTLAEFVEQELRQAESTFAVLVDEVLTQWRLRAPSRQVADFDAPRVLHAQAGDFVRAAAASLREQAGGSRSPSKAPRSGKLELSLVDDDEITADIEIARAVERSNAELEEPMRELRTYTSALVGDVNSARDTNPLRPEVWVRAMLAGARGVTIAPHLQRELLRTATPLLIKALQGRYDDACARLRAAGVDPAVHRTIVNEGVVTELTDAMRARRMLDRAHDALGPETVFGEITPTGWTQRTVEPDRRPSPAGSSADRASARQRATPGSASRAGDERHHVERLSQLYDAILADRRLPRESLPLLSRLYPAVLRQTLAEPALLVDAAHPVWSLIDHVAFLVLTRGVGDSKANMTLATGLVEQIAGQSTADARSFQSAANRLAVLERQRFSRAVSAAAGDIAKLTPRGDTASTVPQALDASSTDSQPLPLLRRGADTQRTPGEVVSAWRAGAWLTIFLRGRWRRTLVLWRAPLQGQLLLLDAGEARHWALHAPALERLAAEGLARAFGPRSLIGDAIERVARPGPRASAAE
jgi:hypothetical protein